MNTILETTFTGPMTGYEFTYRIGRRAAQTMRRFGWNIEEATARFQRDMDESSAKPVTIVSVTEIGYDTVKDNLSTPTPGPAVSTGHIGFSGSFEYFWAANGDLYRANKNNPLDTEGYRMGARFESTKHAADYFLTQAGLR